MNLGVLVITFLGVNFDFFFMLLFLLKKYRVSQVIIGYLIGVIILLTASYSIGAVLASFLPEWILGLLGVLPIYIALHDNDEEQDNDSKRSPIITVLLTYVSVCAGCVLAIFLPVMVGESFKSFLITLLIIAMLTIVIVFIVKLVADMKIVTGLMDRYGEILMKVCYVLIGLYVFWDSGLISHLIALF
ncbi:cadmium resistance transporter [Weissella paramesenteroides]|uniref:cadmium resistance transporter n=1 Tax=Weissella paramesenteroides TaxID=1249 RepID=UPI002E7C471E|nr:cadmium resistance transporter [Weissella paramesenteroides]WPQ68531.1 cadmium resistance transporter [Weissella paramesenteroides]